MKKVRVIGAGMSGLLVAYYARERGLDVEVYDKDTEVGGKIRTLHSPQGLMETAANAILADREVETLAAAIGLELIEAQAEARRRWIFLGGRLRRWPLGAKSSLAVFKFLIDLKFRKESLRPRTGELLQAWGERVLGREATDHLISPACQGIFGVGAPRLSAALVFNYFFPATKRERGVLRGSVAPQGGMGELPRLLRKYLESRGVSFHLGKTLERAEGVTVVATDLPAAAEILESFGDPRAATLRSLPSVALYSCNAFFEGESPAGFGVLFPRDQKVEPLGVLFNSAIFPGRAARGTSETWIFGPDTDESDVNHFVGALRSARQKILKGTGHLVEMNINRWPKAIPLYGLELENALETMPAGHAHIHLMGNYLGDIGLNRLFHRARKLADSL